MNVLQKHDFGGSTFQLSQTQKVTFGSKADGFWDVIFSLNFLKVPGKGKMQPFNDKLKQ